ncbi:MAG TPA: tetratricopeptide repeat protein [Vicinamibacteria bacterium]
MRRALALAAGLLLPGAAFAQSSPEEQARGLLEDGRGYLRDGKNKQALDNFNTIVSGFANTDSVDDALLEIGRYQAEVEKDPAKAREAFEQVAKRFPQSDGAPGAYYQLGRLSLERAATAAELEDALAQFERVQRLYPGSDWVPRALAGAAQAHRQAGRLPEALDSARRAALEYPSSPAAPEALFHAGHALALLGEPRQAMEEYQQIRNRFPESEWAPRALDRITALYRLYGAARPAFGLDPAFTLAGGDVLKDVRALLMTPARTLWVASDKAKGAYPFAPDGKLGAGLNAVDLRSLALSPQGELLVTSRLAVRTGPRDIRTFTIPGDKPGVPEPLEKLEAALITPGGSLLVADNKRKRVYRFDAKLQFQATFPDAKEREVVRMTLDGEGGLVLLDGDARTVQVFDEAGRPLRAFGPRGNGFELRRPSDVAVDAFRNSYVADEAAGAIYVVSPAGQLLTTLSAPEMKKPVALTLDPSGAVLVYDDRAGRVLRFK